MAGKNGGESTGGERLNISIGMQLEKQNFLNDLNKQLEAIQTSLNGKKLKLSVDVSGLKDLNKIVESSTKSTNTSSLDKMQKKYSALTEDLKKYQEQLKSTQKSIADFDKYGKQEFKKTNKENVFDIIKEIGTVRRPQKGSNDDFAKEYYKIYNEMSKNEKDTLNRYVKPAVVRKSGVSSIKNEGMQLDSLVDHPRIKALLGDIKKDDLIKLIAKGRPKYDQSAVYSQKEIEHNRGLIEQQAKLEKQIESTNKKLIKQKQLLEAEGIKAGTNDKTKTVQPQTKVTKVETNIEQQIKDVEKLGKEWEHVKTVVNKVKAGSEEIPIGRSETFRNKENGNMLLRRYGYDKDTNEYKLDKFSEVKNIKALKDAQKNFGLQNADWSGRLDKLFVQSAPMSKNFTMMVDNLIKKMNQLNASSSKTDLSHFNSELRKAESEINKMAKLMDKNEQRKTSLNDYLKELKFKNNITTGQYNEFSKDIKDVDTTSANANNNLQNLKKQIQFVRDGNKDLENLVKEQGKLKAKLEEYQKKGVVGDTRANRVSTLISGATDVKSLGRADKYFAQFAEAEQVKKKIIDLRGELSKLAFAGKTSTESLRNLAIKVNAGNSLRDLARVQREIQGVQRASREAQVTTESFLDMLRNGLTKVPVWGLATGMIYGTKHALEEMLSTIIEVDTQMTQLRRVMSPDTDFNGMLEQSVQLSKDLGNNLKDVNDAMASFARQGFGEQETLDMTKTAVLASNVSDMSASESARDLTAIMTQFNVTAEDSISIVDKLNEVKCLPPYIVMCK